MDYDLDEGATLFEKDPQTGVGSQVGDGTLQAMIAIALSWEHDRFARAGIRTDADRWHGPADIERIGEAEDIYPSEPS